MSGPAKDKIEVGPATLGSTDPAGVTAVADTAPAGTRAAAVVRWMLVAAMAGLAAWAVLSSTVFATEAPHNHVSYTCPMHPQIVQDQPGHCPICGMNLVERAAASAVAPAPAPRPEDARAGDAPVPGLVPVQLTFERRQRIGMKTAPVTRTSATLAARTTGTVAADERRTFIVAARFAGFVEEVGAMVPGSRVRAGDLLARIYSPDLVSAQRELLLSLPRKIVDGTPHLEHGGGASLAAAARERLLLLGIDAADVDAVIQSGKVEHALPLRARAAGIVLERTVVQGQSVETGAPLFKLADLSRVVVLADLYDRDATTAGTKLQVALGGRTVPGTVEALLPSVDPRARVQQARIAVINADGLLTPGVFVDVLLPPRAIDALVIPREALVDIGAAQYVFVEKGEGWLEPRAVVVGARLGEQVEIKRGLASGDVVVTTGNFLVDSESRLQATIHAQASAPSTEPPHAD